MATTLGDAFGDAVDLLFDDDNMTQDATYFPAAGATVTLHVILSKPDLDIDVGTSGLHVSAFRAQVKTVDLPSGAFTGDRLSVGADLYTVRNISRRDALRLVADLDLDPA